MYIQNRRNSSKFKGCSPLQNCNGLISLKPEIAYFAYTQRDYEVPLISFPWVVYDVLCQIKWNTKNSQFAKNMQKS